ncbi:hypothetical protein [Planktothrix agardhii]|uniref:hypothetical protein n=1 Tax=Planktothrix agardhii TaxID=1160 RepID=UPI0003F7FC47|nr:hypothetical protein [Planktothrix agardhii]CAD0220133.1 conserved hypothetical protein [Planktothrix agardhii]CAD5982577.1 hypothetical protein NO758_04918 [Planktothrix agardhii]
MERRKILIATKTYPSISTKYRETVCTAGILLDDNEQPLEWIRIYPIRFRKLDFDKRYPRWSIISVKIEKSDKDSRLESYRIDDSSIEILRHIGTQNNWSERKSFVLPLQFQSIQDIRDQGKSLGIIKPESILKYYYEKDKREWGDKQQGILDQLDLFEIPSDLEKIPYKFGYEFIENNQVKHKYSISDWEISELYRKCRDRSKKDTLEEREAEALEKVREKLEVDFLNKKDLYFIVGNLKDHRQTFMIIGLFYPPIPKKSDQPNQNYSQLKLFDC